MGSYSMYLYVPKNLFPEWHSVGNTVRSHAEKQNIPTELHRYLQHCKNNQTASLLLLAVQRQLPTVKVTHFLTSSNVNHFDHTYNLYIQVFQL